MSTKLDDTVEPDPDVNPADILDCLTEAVNYAWKVRGDDSDCNVPATFLGWLIQENERLEARMREIASQCHNLPRGATADRIDQLARGAPSALVERE